MLHLQKIRPLTQDICVVGVLVRLHQYIYNIAAVLLNKEVVATGMGLNKKQAEQLADERALTVLGV